MHARLRIIARPLRAAGVNTLLIIKVEVAGAFAVRSCVSNRYAATL